MEAEALRENRNKTGPSASLRISAAGSDARIAPQLKYSTNLLIESSLSRLTLFGGTR